MRRVYRHRSARSAQSCDVAQVGKKLIETDEMKMFRQSVEQLKERCRCAALSDDPFRIISINEPAEPPLASKDPFLVKACRALLRWFRLIRGG